MASLHSFPISTASDNDFTARAAPDLTADASDTLPVFRDAAARTVAPKLGAK